MKDSLSVLSAQKVSPRMEQEMLENKLKREDHIAVTPSTRTLSESGRIYTQKHN